MSWVAIKYLVTYPLEKLGSRGTSHPNTGYFLVFPQEKKGEKKEKKKRKEGKKKGKNKRKGEKREKKKRKKMGKN